MNDASVSLSSLTNLPSGSIAPIAPIAPIAERHFQSASEIPETSHRLIPRITIRSLWFTAVLSILFHILVLMVFGYFLSVFAIESSLHEIQKECVSSLNSGVLVEFFDAPEGSENDSNGTANPLDVSLNTLDHLLLPTENETPESTPESSAIEFVDEVRSDTRPLPNSTEDASELFGAEVTMTIGLASSETGTSRWPCRLTKTTAIGGKESGGGGAILAGVSSGEGRGSEPVENSGISNGQNMGSVVGISTGRSSGKSSDATPDSKNRSTYPTSAQRKNKDGIVLLEIEVLASGKIGQVKIKQSSGHIELDEAALISAKKWRFTPAMKEGVAVVDWVAVPVEYRLKK